MKRKKKKEEEEEEDGEVRVELVRFWSIICDQCTNLSDRQAVDSKKKRKRNAL